MRTKLEECLLGHGHPAQASARGCALVRPRVLQRDVIPDYKVTIAPPVAVHIGRRVEVVKQFAEQHIAVCCCKTLDARGLLFGNEQDRASGAGVRKDNRTAELGTKGGRGMPD